MKKFFALALLIFALAIPKKSVAHVLEKSETVGAVMHISPDDDPKAGEKSDIFLEFNDDAFDPADCECTASLVLDGKTVFTQPLFQNTQNPSLTDATLSYVFPKRGTYTLVIEGKPTEEDSFEAFRLEYAIAVSKEREVPPVSQLPESKNQTNRWIKAHTIHLFGVGVIVLFFLGAVVRENRKKRNGKHFDKP